MSVINSASYSPPAGFNTNNPIVGWHNVASGFAASAGSAANFPVANLANPSSYLKWRSAGSGSQTITGNLTTSSDTNYLAILGHNFFSTGATVALTLSLDGGGTSDVIPAMSTTHDGMILFRFPDLTAVGFTITLGAGNAAPEMISVFAGNLLLLQRRLYVGHAPINFNPSIGRVTNESINGEFLGSLVLSETVETKLDLKNITPDYFRTDIDPWCKALRTRPFFFAWRPGTYPDELSYCWVPSGSAQVSNQLPNGMVQVTMGLRGLIDG